MQADNASVLDKKEEAPVDHTDSHGTSSDDLDEKISRYKEFIKAEEYSLIRETFFLLQGISGKRLKLQQDGRLLIKSPAATAPLISLLQPTRIGSGCQDAFQQLGEAGRLYNRCKAFVERRTDSVVLRALQQATNVHLQSYLEYLAQLERNNPNISLRRILVETRPTRQHLYSLALVVEGVMHLTGPDVLSALVMHAQHGNVKHADLVQSLLHAAAKPWWNLTSQWVTRGSLLVSATSLDFFVSAVDGVDAKDLWSKGYALHVDRVPTIFDQEIVEQAYQVGKGVNYIRRVLCEETWCLKIDDDKSDDQAAGNDSPETSNRLTMYDMRRTIRHASTQVHSCILDSLRSKYLLMDHMNALKQFLLLGQGDFYSALMDGLHAEYGFYDNNGKIVYRYDVVSIMETALQNTNASDFNDDVLGRLQVKLRYDQNDDSKYMFGAPKADAKSVWDLFGLEYTLPDPLVAVVDERCMRNYNELFLYLFGVKRVEYMLHMTWRQSAVLQHAVEVVAQTSAIKVTNNAAYARANIFLRQVAMTRQAMTHFVVNLKNYLFFEVLEGGWDRLAVKMERAEALDEVVHAHGEYLETIKRKSLLPANLKSDGTAENTSTLGEHLHELLKLAKMFCDYQHQVFASALVAVDIAAEKRRIAEKRVDHGSWGFEAKESIEQETFFGLSDTAELESVGDLSSEFDRQIKQLIVSIDQKLRGGSVWSDSTAQRHGGERGEIDYEGRDDLDSLRFLKFQLAGNGYYDN
ncbi:gamma-tubulin complex component 3 [Mayamaea pseudoterrestris]|nr:gamma-tubulin complex component 3 [Mayamaea pseudoterrestris]